MRFLFSCPLNGLNGFLGHTVVKARDLTWITGLFSSDRMGSGDENRVNLHVNTLAVGVTFNNAWDSHKTHGTARLQRCYELAYQDRPTAVTGVFLLEVSFLMHSVQFAVLCITVSL